MNYLNLEIADLNSEQVKGSDPVERGTWLMLQTYCAGQENGGRIEGARRWNDRKWQQLAAITLKEVKRECALWSWDGDDLIVWAYPVEQEEVIRRNRENGSKGGRPRKPTPQPKPEPNQNHPVSDGLTEGFDFAETKRKGIGKEGKEREGNAPKPPAPPAPAEKEPSGIDALKIRVNGLRAEWSKPARWSYAEDQHLFGGAAAQLEELTEADWSLLRAYLSAPLPQSAGYWQPKSRAKLCETFADVWGHVQRWANKGNGPSSPDGPTKPIGFR
jgi:hypothetical protein